VEEEEDGDPISGNHHEEEEEECCHSVSVGISVATKSTKQSWTAIYYKIQ
jgi:hypothetical protein